MEMHERMRQARERKGLSLSDLQEKACVRAQVLALIEMGSFADLPSGLYGRHAVRAYAKAVGLNPDEVLAEVGAHLRIPEDPLEGLVRVHGLGRSPRAEPVPAPRVAAPGVPGPTSRPAMAIDWPSAAVSAVDGVLLIFLVLILLQLTALTARLRLTDVVDAAAPAIALLAALVGFSYFVLLGGLRNATFGWTFVHGRPARAAEQLTARVILRRGISCALREGSILVDWLVASEHWQQCVRMLRMRRV
jgi:transcriptional regulator with XRE-family HTH domain